MLEMTELKKEHEQTYIIPEQNKSVLAGVSGSRARSPSGNCHDATVHFRRLGTPVD